MTIMPTRYTSALRQYDRAVIEYCQRAVDAKPGRLGPILQALGRIERVLATGPVFRKDDKGRTRIPPLQGLSPQWLDQADDGSASSGWRPPSPGSRLFGTQMSGHSVPTLSQSWLVEAAGSSGTTAALRPSGPTVSSQTTWQLRSSDGKWRRSTG